MVSCTGAERYHADLVRLLSPNAGPKAPPFREELVKSPINGEHLGREQRLHGGSWAVVRPHPRLTQLKSFTLQAMIWPTTPDKGRQAIMGSWAEPNRSGYGLGIDEKGRLELRLGDGSEVFRLDSGETLIKRKWYLVAASFDAGSGEVVLYQEPLADKGFAPSTPIRVAAKTRLRPTIAAGPFLFAAWLMGEAAAPTSWERVLVGGRFHGHDDRARPRPGAPPRGGIAPLAGNVVPSGLREGRAAPCD